jgi:hypothetical protein
MANDGERQRRELEEIRRSFLEMGTKMGSLFEPAQQNGNGAGDAQAEAPAQPATTVWRKPIVIRLTTAVVVALVCLLVGTGIGRVLPRATAADDGGTPSVPPTTAAPRPRVVVPPECLHTAQLGDQVIDMLMQSNRDQRLSLVFKQYTEASQACRKEASR